MKFDNFSIRKKINQGTGEFSGQNTKLLMSVVLGQYDKIKKVGDVSFQIFHIQHVVFAV